VIVPIKAGERRLGAGLARDLVLLGGELLLPLGKRTSPSGLPAGEKVAIKTSSAARAGKTHILSGAKPAKIVRRDKADMEASNPASETHALFRLRTQAGYSRANS